MVSALLEFARFAEGYFFLSGLESIAERLDGVKELHLLIGNTTNRETLEQLAEGYRRLEMVQDTIEAQTCPKRTEMAQMANETANNIRSAVEQMDQTDLGEVLVKTLARMIEEAMYAIYEKQGNQLSLFEEEYEQCVVRYPHR